VDYAEPRFSARQISGIAFVVLLHIGIIYALLSGLGEEAVQVLRQPLEAKIIEQVKLPPPEAPPPPPPQFITPPPVFIPPPVVQIAKPPPPPAVPVIASVTAVRPVAPPPKPVPQVPVQKTAAGLDPNQSCAPPDYPQEAEDMGQTGVSVVQFLIGSDGHVLESRVAGSSGHAALDQAALTALGECKFKPAIGADGNPLEAWTSIRYVWQLN
jgi:protein TonB